LTTVKLITWVAQISNETVRQTLKKPSQALAKGSMVHSDSGCGIGVSDGGGFRPLICKVFSDQFKISLS